MHLIKSNKCNLAIRFMTIFILILIIVLGIVFYFRYYSDFAKSDKDIKIELDKEIVPEEKIDYEQIKKDIATGKLDEVPEGVDKTKRLIIREYLYDCHFVEDINKKLECYEDYYFNTDPELKVQKNNCEQLQGNERTECLDQLYFKLANEKQSVFCNVVVDLDLKKECLEME